MGRTTTSLRTTRITSLHCQATNVPVAGLLSDLEARGLLDEPLVIWGGEFDRMPISQNGFGREHNPNGFLEWMDGWCWDQGRH
jgi:hypothetical protein